MTEIEAAVPGTVRSHAAQRFEFGGRFVELGDYLAVAPPRSPQFVEFGGCEALEPAPGIVVLGLSTLMPKLESIESLPKGMIEPLGPLML